MFSIFFDSILLILVVLGLTFMVYALYGFTRASRRP
jgi:hypothetical protein